MQIQTAIKTRQKAIFQILFQEQSAQIPSFRWGVIKN